MYIYIETKEMLNGNTHRWATPDTTNFNLKQNFEGINEGVNEGAFDGAFDGAIKLSPNYSIYQTKQKNSNAGFM